MAFRVSHLANGSHQVGNILLPSRKKFGKGKPQGLAADKKVSEAPKPAAEKEPAKAPAGDVDRFAALKDRLAKKGEVIDNTVARQQAFINGVVEFAKQAGVAEDMLPDFVSAAIMTHMSKQAEPVPGAAPASKGIFGDMSNPTAYGLGGAALGIQVQQLIDAAAGDHRIFRQQKFRGQIRAAQPARRVQEGTELPDHFPNAERLRSRNPAEKSRHGGQTRFPAAG